MDLQLNISKKGLSTTEEVINEEYTLHYGHIFRGKSAYQYAVESGLFNGTEEEFEKYVGNIGNLSKEAQKSIEDAKKATTNAVSATQATKDATVKANKAIDYARLATNTATEAASKAHKAKEETETATQNANEATQNVEAVLNEFNEQRNNYVQKVEGKGLSTNDYTDEDKAKVDDIGDNTIIVDYDRIAELKAFEENDDVRHPEIAELVRKIYNEQEKLILVRHFSNTHEQLDPTYFVPDTNYGRDEFGNVIIALYASYTPNYNTYGEQRLINLEIIITQTGAIIRVEQKQVTLLNDESVIDNLNYPTSKRPLSARQGQVLKRELDKKPNSDGYYPTMTVGKADNLVSRGDVQDAQINFRPSAGADNITDGAARIERIKGNSVVYNQLITNSQFESKTNYDVAGGATLDIDSGIATITLGASNYSGITNIELNNKLVVGHKYLFITEAKADADMPNVYVPYVASASVSPKNTLTTEWGTYTFIYEATSTAMSYGVVRAGTYGTDFQSGDKIYAKSFRVIDLTKMFGAGNEPTSYKEYLQRKPMNIEDEFAYNEGELIDMKVDSLISTSDNAYDYVKGYARVMGGHTYDCSYSTAFVEKVYFSTNKDNIVAEENAMTSENGKYTFPSDGYAVPYTTDGDVRDYCVCLQHTYTKPHPPYQQEVKDLSFIGEAFPEGMRSATAAPRNYRHIYDELFFNTTIKKWTLVKRIGYTTVTKDTPINKDTNAQCAFTVNRQNLQLEGTPKTYGGCTTNNYGLDRNTTIRAKGLYFNNSLLIFNLGDDSNVTTVEALKSLLETRPLQINYELAEPIVEEIDLSPNFNLDYFAWDFGTEEAIASVPSTPFRADINYEPNAVDDLRWAIGEIRSLRTQLSQLQSAQASETNLTE